MQDISAVAVVMLFCFVASCLWETDWKTRCGVREPDTFATCHLEMSNGNFNRIPLLINMKLSGIFQVHCVNRFGKLIVLN